MPDITASRTVPYLLRVVSSAPAPVPPFTSYSPAPCLPAHSLPLTRAELTALRTRLMPAVRTALHTFLSHHSLTRTELSGYLAIPPSRLSEIFSTRPLPSPPLTLSLLSTIFNRHITTPQAIARACDCTQREISALRAIDLYSHSPAISSAD